MEIEGMSIWKYSAGRMCKWGQPPIAPCRFGLTHFGEAVVFTKEGKGCCPFIKL